MLIDESDERMFRDLPDFYKNTKHEKHIVICLTATPYEGEEDGSQMNVLRELKYKIYKNSDQKEDYDPTIH